MQRLVYFYNQGHEAHFEAGHPERPDRVESIVTALMENDYWEPFLQLSSIEIPTGVMHTVHAPGYLELLEETCRRGVHFDADTYTTPASWDLAQSAAGGAVAVASAVWQRDAERGFALTRPPGHHATRERAMGFCLINNVAVAAQYLIDQYSAGRLAIIDLDLHHGNGTQDIFYSRGDVLYISTHQYPHYPGTGWINEVGEGEGRLATANLPLPAFSGDSAFMQGMQEFILPLLDRFQPEMLLISFGFDPHFDDPLGNLQLTSGGYGDLIRELVVWSEDNCQGKIALFLEGGYNLEAARACSLTAVAALLGDPYPERFDQHVHQDLAGESGQFSKILEQAKLNLELE